jgi:DNA primase catalytic subunit
MEISLAFLEKLGKFDKQISDVILSLKAETEKSINEKKKKEEQIEKLLEEMIQKDKVNMKLSMEVAEKDSRISELEMKLQQIEIVRAHSAYASSPASPATPASPASSAPEISVVSSDLQGAIVLNLESQKSEVHVLDISGIPATPDVSEVHVLDISGIPVVPNVSVSLVEPVAPEETKEAEITLEITKDAPPAKSFCCRGKKKSGSK